MDSDTLVTAPTRIEGGAMGLDRAARLLREAGLPLIAVYLLAVSGEMGARRWYLRLVTDADQYDALFKAIEVRKTGSFPRLDDSVIISPVRSNNPEAQRILNYARKMGEESLVIDGQMIDGLYVDYALVGSSFHVAA